MYSRNLNKNNQLFLLLLAALAAAENIFKNKILFKGFILISISITFFASLEAFLSKRAKGSKLYSFYF
jgi:hypothetical protein